MKTCKIDGRSWLEPDPCYAPIEAAIWFTHEGRLIRAYVPRLRVQCAGKTGDVYVPPSLVFTEPPAPVSDLARLSAGTV